MLIFQKVIRRDDLRYNSGVLYLFGDNEARVGLGGLARECRGEPNAVGIATKRRPGLAEADFWSDDDFEACSRIVSADFERAFACIRKGGVVVCPMGGLGTGLAQLPRRAPRILAHIRETLVALRRTERA